MFLWNVGKAKQYTSIAGNDERQSELPQLHERDKCGPHFCNRRTLDPLNLLRTKEEM